MSVPQDEIKEWRLAIEQVIYSNEYERNIHPLKLKASVVHGLNSAVRMDHPDALCLMGMCHLRLKLAPSLGEFFEPSAEKGFNLLEKAVEHKSSAAMYQVAECCRLGLGTEVDKRKAVALYERAANEPISFRAAQRQLGILYFDGEAVQQDHRRAVHWFQLASQQDDTEFPRAPLSLHVRTAGCGPLCLRQAVVRLGLCYQLGVGGLDKSDKHALDLFEVGALRNHPFAHACIARAYDTGAGHRWDPEKALWHYTRAAEGGDALGLIGAAWLLLSGGSGYVRTDTAKALAFLQEAAGQGEPEAQYLLGQCYLNSPPVGIKASPPAPYWETSRGTGVAERGPSRSASEPLCPSLLHAMSRLCGAFPTDASPRERVRRAAGRREGHCAVRQAPFPLHATPCPAFHLAPQALPPCLLAAPVDQTMRDGPSQTGGRVQVDTRRGLDMLSKAASAGIHMANYAIAQVYHFGRHGQAVDLERALANYETSAAKGHEVSKARVGLIRKQLAAQAEEEEAQKKSKGKKK
eukprot:CAMPEP_0177594336 /NCGR_PEP_ID=MMETSP0419_2-20121207/9727_1 /TAXON_ID=582737 /ORGANISM="Tetraselmis sp., Strain GSL018" /LENGTH=520 /DNA_ID=CAMNT_0019085639 /DNA_START=76 /DNA_END=1640 /DNA_ORIENTATION=-